VFPSPLKLPSSGGGIASGGSAKKILLLVQRNQIFWPDVHSECSLLLGFSSGSPTALHLFCEFDPFAEFLPVGEVPPIKGISLEKGISLDLAFLFHCTGPPAVDFGASLPFLIF